MPYLLFVIFILSLPTAFSADKAITLYRLTLADGKVIYTDQFVPGAQKIELPADNKISLHVPNQQPSPAISKPSHYAWQQLLPADETTIRNNTGEVLIKATLKRNGQTMGSGIYQLWLNDTYHLSHVQPEFRLNNLDRGAYRWQIKAMDKTGKLIALSPQRIFYLHRARVISQ